MCDQQRLTPDHTRSLVRTFASRLTNLRVLDLSKALTCMNFFLYKIAFYQGDGYFWPLCCLNYLYISHTCRSLLAIGSMLISPFRVISWFDTVCNIVTRWVSFRENHLHEYELHLSDYNIYRSILTQIYVFLILFTKVHKQKNIYFLTRNLYIWAKILLFFFVVG